MKQHIQIASSFLFLFLIACNNGDKEASKSENDLDAARNFIRSALDGKFNEAKTFLLNDSTNEQYFDAYQRNYQRVDNDTKRSYRESMINIHNVKQVNDSTTIIIFSNSYKNDHDTLRVLRKKEQWLVDFKYLFEHDSDTLNNPAVKKDTLK